MIKKYRICVDGQYYTGEVEVELNTWKVDPWSGNSFQTRSQQRNILTFEPKKNGNFKVIEGTTNLLGEIRRIIEFCSYTNLMVGDEIIIESEPFGDQIEFDIDYYLGLESENSRLKAVLAEMKNQLDIATDLGDKRWKALNKVYESSAKGLGINV